MSGIVDDLRKLLEERAAGYQTAVMGGLEPEKYWRAVGAYSAIQFTVRDLKELVEKYAIYDEEDHN